MQQFVDPSSEAVKMCENNYGYMVPCHQNHLHQQSSVSPAGVAIAAAAPGPYDDEDYYGVAWTNAEYVPNNSDQCQLE